MDKYTMILTQCYDDIGDIEAFNILPCALSTGFYTQNEIYSWPFHAYADIIPFASQITKSQLFLAERLYTYLERAFPATA